MKKESIKTLEMVRKIRDFHYDKLIGKSSADRIMFYQEKAQTLYNEIRKLSPKDNSGSQ